LTQAKPNTKDNRYIPYDHTGIVKMNDYTKNMSETVFSPGDLVHSQSALTYRTGSNSKIKIKNNLKNSNYLSQSF